MGRRAAIAAGLVLLSAVALRASGVEEEPPDAGGVDRIDVRSAVIPVEARPGREAGAVLESPMAAEFPWDDVAQTLLRQERDASTLHVWIEGDGRPSPEGGERIVVRVPPGTTLRVQTRSAPVTVQGLQGGACRVRTLSGRILLVRSRSRLTADTVSGRIDLDSDEGAVEARTVSGRIEGRRLGLAGNSEFASVSGAIDVELAADIEDYGFDLRSVSGTITIGAIRAERGLRMGFGGALVNARTVSGSLSFSAEAASSPSAHRRRAFPSDAGQVP